MHETDRISREDRQDDDWSTLNTICKALDCEHLMEKVKWVNRLGAYNPGRRKSRVVKVVFENEHAAGVLRKKAPRLVSHGLLGHMYVKEDESLAERQRKWVDRRRGDIGETGQGNIHRSNPQTERGDGQSTDEPEDEVLAGFVTLDEADESDNETESSEGETRTSVGENSEREEARCSEEEVQKMVQATLKAGMDILGIREGSGRVERIGSESVDERIARLKEVTKRATANRNTQLGNGRSRGNESVD